MVWNFCCAYPFFSLGFSGETLPFLLSPCRLKSSMLSPKHNCSFVFEQCISLQESWLHNKRTWHTLYMIHSYQDSFRNTQTSNIGAFFCVLCCLFNHLFFLFYFILQRKNKRWWLLSAAGLASCNATVIRQQFRPDLQHGLCLVFWHYNFGNTSNNN